jgi:TolA-binding protein
VDVAKSIAKRVVVWLVLGLVGGGMAVDWWERQRAASDLAELRTRDADQLREAESRIKQLSAELQGERQRRQALEGIVADLRKGS